MRMKFEVIIETDEAEPEELEETITDMLRVMDNHIEEKESLIAQSRAKGANLTDVLERYAKVGDKICCGFNFPWPHTKTLSLDTPEAAAYANELLDQENCAWRLKRSNIKVRGAALPSYD